MPELGAAPWRKRAMRAVFLRLPRSATSYKLAKAFTRTVCRPARRSSLATVRLRAGFAMQVDFADIVGNDLYCMDDHYEARSLAVWRDLATTSATIVDLGSQTGLYACAAAAVNPAARVLAVEGHAPNLPRLRGNAAAFPGIDVVDAVIGLEEGQGVFRTSPITGGGYLETTASSSIASTPGMRGRSGDDVVVTTTTIAALCAGRAVVEIDLVKIDLEGLEEPLLCGHEAFWSRHRPRHVLVELALPAARPSDESPMLGAMAARGYRARRLERLYTVPWLRQEMLANWLFSRS